MKKRLLSLLGIIFAAILLVSCGKKTFEVDFDLNGGTSEAIAVQKVKDGGLVTEPNDPERVGHTFEGWTFGDELWNFGSDKVKGKTTLVASWELRKFDVVFNTKGGAPVPATQRVGYGEKALEPEALPALEGNEFLGWYLNNLEYNFNSVITKAITLEAKWGVKVTFDADGGLPVPAEQIVKVGELVEEPAEPTRENATFLGWYVKNVKFEFDTPVEAKLELQARWEINYDAVIADLEAHYADTFGNIEWHPTENVELLAEISGLPITWTSSDETYFSNAGEVTIPSFTEGDQTIMLTATLTPLKSKTFFFTVEALEQTTEELLDEILRVVTIVPSTISGYQEENFDAVASYKIAGEDVPITWETSDATVMKATGELVGFEDAPEKEVTLTATITYDGVTRVKEIEFLVKGVTSYDSLLGALIDENKGEKVKVEEVSFFMPIKAGSATPGGYYIASKDNQIGYVHGNPPATLKEGKLYDVLFEVDIYYGTYQLKNPAFVNERDGDLPVITAVEMTLEDIVNLTKPETLTFNQTYLKLTDVMVFVEDANDNYGTFLVNQDFEPGVTNRNDENSLMLYYMSNMEVIQNLDGKRIDEILLINNGYRTNNIVWYVNYIGNGSDIVMGALTDEEAVLAAKEQLENEVPFKVINDDDLTLTTEAFGASIDWASSEATVIDPLTGEVTLEEEALEVTLTATIVLGELELTFARVVWVGTPEELGASNIVDVIEYDGSYKLMPFKVEGVVTGSVGDKSYTMYDGVDAIAIYGEYLDIGYKYTVVGYKDVYNGLVQLKKAVNSVKGAALEVEEPIVLTEADLKDNAYLLTIQAHLVSILEAEIIKISVDNYNTYEITLKVGTAQVIIRWDNRVPVKQEDKDKLAELVVGDVVTIDGAALGWYKGPQLGYTASSQIMPKIPETDEGIVAAAIAALNVPQIVTESLTPPSVGRFGATITWVTSHPEVIAPDGTLVMPEENTEVTITGTFSHGDYSEEVLYVVLVQVDEGVLSVKLAKEEAADAIVKFQGIVTGMEPQRYVYVSDVDGSTIVMFQPVRPEGLALGDKVLVEGKIAHYNGLIQIAAEGTITILETDLTLPLAVEVEKIPEFKVADQGKRYSIENLFVVSVNARTLVATDGIKNVTVYVDPANDDLNALLLSAVGKKINLVEIHLGWYNGGQFLIQHAEQVVVEELSDEDKALLDLMEIVLPKTVGGEDELSLPTIGALHESVIVWSSSDELIVAADGTITLPEEDTPVTLTATATLGEDVAIKTFEILVKKVGAAVEQEAVMKYSGTTGNMEEDNQAEVVNLNPNVFTVLGKKGAAGQNIGLNDSGQIRLYSVRASGDGNELEVSVKEGNVITALEFKFTATTGSTVQAISAVLMLGDTEVLLNEADLKMTKVYTDLEITSFELKNTHEGGDKNGQLWILEVVITYLGEEGEPV